jgi:hypothetical protein
MSNDLNTAAVEANEKDEKVRVHILVVAVLNIAAAALWVISSAMIFYNLNMTEFEPKTQELATTLSIVLLALAVPYLLLGIGLLLKFRIARFAAILLGFIHLVELPAGTLLGFYMLWLFLTQNTDAYFAKDATPELKIYSEDD